MVVACGIHVRCVEATRVCRCGVGDRWKERQQPLLPWRTSNCEARLDLDFTSVQRHLSLDTSTPVSRLQAHHRTCHHSEQYHRRHLCAPETTPTICTPTRHTIRINILWRLQTNTHLQPIWERESQEVFWPRASSATTAVSSSGQIFTTRRDCWVPHTSPRHSEYVHPSVKPVDKERWKGKSMGDQMECH